MKQKSPEEAVTRQASTLERSLSAGFWSLLDTVFQKILIYGSFFIVARLLTPEDYGIIALAMVYPNLLDSLTAIAFDTALTQRKTGEERPFLSIVWTFNLIRVFIVFAIVFTTSFLFADFFHAPNALLLFQLSALPLLIQGFANIGQVYFFRELNLKKVFIRDMASYGTNAIVSIIFALVIHSYWALFLGSVSGMFAAVVATYILQEYRPKLDFGFKKLRPLLNYSQWVFGQGLVSRLAQTVEDAVVGHYTNPTSVGNYSKAKSLAYAPTSPLANIVGKIGFSALVATGGSLPHAREGFYKSLDLTLSVAIPFSVAIWLLGDKLVYIVLGESWMGITPLLKALVIVSGLNASILSIAGMIFNSMGNPHLLFRLNIISLISTIIFLPILVINNGIVGAALSLLITAVIVNCYALYLIGFTINPTWKRVFETGIVTLLSSILPLLIIMPLLNTSILENNLLFLLLTAFYGVLYAILLILIGKIWLVGPLKTLLIIVRSLSRRSNGNL